jgi:hypothetical protein
MRDAIILPKQVELEEIFCERDSGETFAVPFGIHKPNGAATLPLQLYELTL